jgi:N utilization substance protein A
MKSEFEIAITQLSADRNLTPDVIIEAIEMALVSAYKRNYGPSQNVQVELDRRTGQARVFVKKLVAEEIEDDRNEMTLAEAHALDPAAKLGDFIDVEVMPRDFGRIAAQTAKQVITQRIREAERDSVFAEFAEREGELVNGTVREIDVRTRTVGVSLGKAEAVLPRGEQIAREHYRVGQRVRVYIVAVERTARGPQITVSRTHPDLLKRLLELEVPEIYNGTVEVKAIAREPGYRSKVAVAALQSGVDPVGSCVGMRGVRIQNIVNELAGEKIDVVEWSRDERVFIANALSPAKVVEVYLNREEKAAKVIVPDRALSLAIGKEGQNARLAAKLTGWRIDIKSEAEAAEEAELLAAEAAAAAEREREREEARRAAAALLAEAEALMDEEEQELDEAVEAVLAPDEAQAELLDLPFEPEEIEAEPVAEVDAPAPDAAFDLAPETELPSALDDVVEAERPDQETLASDIEEWDQDLDSEQEVVATEMTSAVSDQDETMASDGEPQVRFELEKELPFEEEDEEEDSGARGRDGKRRRDRRFEYDERLGRVVARKQHKRSGGREWDEDLD